MEVELSEQHRAFITRHGVLPYLFFVLPLTAVLTFVLLMCRGAALAIGAYIALSMLGVL